MRATFLLRSAFLAAGVVGLALGGVSAAGLEGLDVVTSSGPHHFEVEIAATEAAREHGLMNRKFLAADRGMLFEFGDEAPRVFWMKDTPLSLDLIFIGADGKVRSIADHAEPLSEAAIPSGPPAEAVLEVNAGVAAQIGVKPGDKVVHPFFKK